MTTTRPLVPLLVLLASIAPEAASTALAAELHGTLEIEYANADGSYRPPVRWALGDLSRAVIADRFDGNGSNDLVVAYETLDPRGLVVSHVRYLKGSTSGNLELGLDLAVGVPGELVVGLRGLDFNGDGNRDFEVYVSRESAGTGRVDHPRPLRGERQRLVRAADEHAGGRTAGSARRLPGPDRPRRPAPAGAGERDPAPRWPVEPADRVVRGARRRERSGRVRVAAGRQLRPYVAHHVHAEPRRRVPRRPLHRRRQLPHARRPEHVRPRRPRPDAAVPLPHDDAALVRALHAGDRAAAPRGLHDRSAAPGRQRRRRDPGSLRDRERRAGARRLRSARLRRGRGRRRGLGPGGAAARHGRRHPPGVRRGRQPGGGVRQRRRLPVRNLPLHLPGWRRRGADVRPAPRLPGRQLR